MTGRARGAHGLEGLGQLAHLAPALRQRGQRQVVAAVHPGGELRVQRPAGLGGWV